MGGMGSGGWYRYSRKPTVEESFVVGMGHLRTRLYAGAAGTLTWTRASGGKSSIGYFVTGGDHGPIVTLHYRWRDAEDVSIPIRLEWTRTQFDGRRWWFLCPLIARGVACNRRTGKLYLPPGARYFGCRKCHDLTYRSCQEAHRTERLFVRLGLGPEVARMWDRMHRTN